MATKVDDAEAGAQYNFKIVLLGEGCVGKTSLLQCYIQGEFNSEHVSTLQATFFNKKIHIDDKKVNVSIWDTAGQEKFHALGPIYYRNSNGVILVYDITAKDSFVKVQNWVKEIQKLLGPDVVLCIAGNKVDLELDRTVSIEEAESYANTVGARHFHTSAKLSLNVEQIFHELTKEMVKKAIEVTKNDSNKSLHVDEDEPQKKLLCCSGFRS